MANSHTEMGAEVSRDYVEDQNASAVASVLLTKFDVINKGQLSIIIENNESGGGQTTTTIVWISHELAPATVAHAGVSGWAQLGSDIVSAPGDRSPFSWTTRARWVGVTTVATGAITGKVSASVVSAPPS